MKSLISRKRLSIPILVFLLVLPLLLKSNSWACWQFGESAMSMMGKMMGMSPGKGDRNKMRRDMCPMMGRMPVKGIAPEYLPEPESQEAELYSNYCRQCHALPNPKAHSAREWEESFRRMDARMQMMGRMRMMKMCRMMNIEAPNEAEKEAILGYLQRHALKVIKKEALPAPESTGALLFKNTCSQCHDLPDPQNHTPEEWPLVVDKMENYLNDSKELKQLTKKEKETIVKYLAENT